ncbi:MAG TPA: ABC transporter permease [Candidatus Coprenecus pullistercoris]|nr:ABC transporter permease [Candidatus Coprenecus pullistercoris]
MKLGLYFKQAWYNLRVNRVYSAVFIAGTALSLALVMAFLTVLSSRVLNTAPERHRDRTMVVYGLEGGDENMIFYAEPNYRFGQDFLEDIHEVECWTAVRTYYDIFAALENTDEELTYAYAKLVDLNFWKIFDLDFLYGRPISENGMDVNTPEAVISESLARTLAGRSDAVGEKVYWDGHMLTVCGVVRDVPMSATLAFSEIWLPSTVNAPPVPKIKGFFYYAGGGEIVALLRDRKDMPGVMRMVEERVERMNNSDESVEKMTVSGMSSQRQYIFAGSDIASSAFAWLGAGVVLLILLVPLLNLSGMVNSRMEARLTEFGTRKAFGAGARSILAQIAGENLLMTLIGGLSGLLLAWLLIVLFSRQMNALVPGSILSGIYVYRVPESGFFDFRDFFNIGLYAVLLVILAVLNMISAVIPAVKVIRRPITESLNDKK